MGFLKQVNIFSSAYDKRLHNYDVTVIVTPQTGNEKGNLP